MKSEQRGGPEDHRGSADPVRAQKQCPEPEQNALQSAEIGRSVPGPIENQELLLKQEVLGHYGPSTTGFNDSGQRGQQMSKEQQQVLHGATDCARLPSTARHPKRLLKPHQIPIRHAQVRRSRFGRSQGALSGIANPPSDRSPKPASFSTACREAIRVSGSKPS